MNNMLIAELMAPKISFCFLANSAGFRIKTIKFPRSSFISHELSVRTVFFLLNFACNA
jgi:hypothetical protein